MWLDAPQMKEKKCLLVGRQEQKNKMSGRILHSILETSKTGTFEKTYKNMDPLFFVGSIPWIN